MTTHQTHKKQVVAPSRAGSSFVYRSQVGWCSNTSTHVATLPGSEWKSAEGTLNTGFVTDLLFDFQCLFCFMFTILGGLGLSLVDLGAWEMLGGSDLRSVHIFCGPDPPISDLCPCLVNVFT